jgi:hypothetical protein
MLYPSRSLWWPLLPLTTTPSGLLEQSFITPFVIRLEDPVVGIRACQEILARRLPRTLQQHRYDVNGRGRDKSDADCWRGILSSCVRRSTGGQW